MKWARLMFGREFRVESVLLLWDHIFASSWIEGRPDVPECIECVAVAMVRACLPSWGSLLGFLVAQYWGLIAVKENNFYSFSPPL